MFLNDKAVMQAQIISVLKDEIAHMLGRRQERQPEPEPEPEVTGDV